MNEKDLKHRPIRSYVLREGRMTPAQKRAFDEHWQEYGINYAATPLDLTALFGRQAPCVLEIGFGNGEALLHAATHDAARNYIGIEVHRPGVGRLMNALAADALSHVRIFRHDAVEILRDTIPAHSLDEIRVWFPDPWPKKKHHKRRIINPEFVALAASRVRAGGLLHLATDWQPYAEHMVTVLAAASDWCNCATTGDFVERPAWRIKTHFEARGRRLGHGVWDLLYRREPVQMPDHF